MAWLEKRKGYATQEGQAEANKRYREKNKAGSNDAVLVVGYDANNVVLYDPAVGQTYKWTTADADEMFFNAGNIFLFTKSKKNT